MPPFFNDSRRDFDLKELCGACGHRDGAHSMYNKCPQTKPNGAPVRHEFQDKQEFVRTGSYEMEEV